MLDWVENTHIEFVHNKHPIQVGGPRVIRFNHVKSIDSEVLKLLCKGVIVESKQSQGEFNSPLFLRLKMNGVDYRVILNR